MQKIKSFQFVLSTAVDACIAHSASQIFAKSFIELVRLSPPLIVRFWQRLSISKFNAITKSRPQNTFPLLFLCCRNSKPLPISEGYWAEPWPVSETPLCAVIDPARDYRWHALKCGGPETSAFLCEMESELSFSMRR